MNLHNTVAVVISNYHSRTSSLTMYQENETKPKKDELLCKDGIIIFNYLYIFAPTQKDLTPFSLNL